MTQTKLKINPITGKLDLINKIKVFNNLAPVIENTVSDPSTLTPNTGDSYIPANPSIGVWAGQYPNIATWNGTTWIYYTPQVNDRTTVSTGVNANKVYEFNGVDWIEQVGIISTTDWVVGGNILAALGKFGSLTNQPISIITNNIQAIRINATQNVNFGLGNPDPSYRVTIRDDLYIQNSVQKPFSLTTATNFNGTSSFQYGIYNFISCLTNTNFAVTGGANDIYLYGGSVINSLIQASKNTISVRSASVGTGDVVVNDNFLELSTATYTSNARHILNNNTAQLSSFYSTIQNLDIVKSKLFSFDSVTGTVTNLKFYKVETEGIMPIVVNSTVLDVGTTYDAIAATNKWVINSLSSAKSFHLGSFEFGTNIRLRGVSNFVTIQANSGTSPYTMILPTTIGTNGFVLTTNGLGQTDWTDPNINDIPEWIAPPLTSTSTGLQGQKAQDALYVYFCYADNTWARTSRDLTIW